MKILVDGNEANVEKKVGISEYAYNLLIEFHKKASEKLQFEVLLKSSPLSDLPKETEHFEYTTVTPRPLWTQIGLPLYLERYGSGDVFFTTSHYGPRFGAKKMVISVMDLSFLHFPGTFKKRDLIKLNRWTRASAKRAESIITISQSSKNDIIRHYGIDKKRIIVVYPGLKKSFSKSMTNNKIPEKYNVQNKYILYVGTLQPRKNIERLIEAFSKVGQKETDLVIIGKRGWKYEGILNAPEKFGVADRVKFLEYVTDEDLPLFYKNAECFVLPSLYEGFGIPVLEAMKYDCPVLTSNVSSLPEAGGDAAVYFDPLNTDDIREKIEEVLGDEKKRKDMIEKGRRHVQKFSWEKSAEDVLEVLTKVANS